LNEQDFRAIKLAYQAVVLCQAVPKHCRHLMVPRLFCIITPSCLTPTRSIPSSVLTSDESCTQSPLDICFFFFHQNLEMNANTNSRDRQTYDITPGVNISSGNRTTLSGPTTGEISKTARTDTMAIHIDERAMNLPGHSRRPNPKTASGSFTLGSRKRSGLNRLGSGNTDSSCSRALTKAYRQ
jgi:hypothetical protein